MLLDEAFRRLLRVAAEFEAAQFAIGLVVDRWDLDLATALEAQRADVTANELARSAASPEVTFSLRLFSAFESHLRDYWERGLGRSSRPDMTVLMDSIARRRQMNAADLQAAHDVRVFRNGVTHSGQLSPTLDLADCQHGLGRYLRWLPQQW